MQAHDIKLSNGVTTYLGKMIVADKALYFLCASTGNALLAGAGIGVGGMTGKLMESLSDKGRYGKLADDITEDDLKAAAAQMKNSIVFEAGKIEKIVQTWAFRMIRWNGKKIGVRSGFTPALKEELKTWAQSRNITIKGF